MRREEFMAALGAGLAGLSEEERRQAVEYYSEMIYDGLENGKAEEDIIAGFEAPEVIAAQICAESGQREGAAPQKPQPQAYAAEGPVHTVMVDAENVRVYVRTGAADTVRVLFQPRESDKITVAQKDGVFQFTQRAHTFSFTTWLDRLCAPHDITLELPVGFDGTVCAQTNNAGLFVSDIQTAAKGLFVTGNARIVVENCAIRQLSAKTSNAQIILTAATGDSCEAATSNGRITAERCTFDSRLWLQTSNAPVRVENAAAPDVLLRSSNGPLTGTLAGDKELWDITSHTSNARSTLPEEQATGQGRRLQAHTSNARIDIAFV